MDVKRNSLNSQTEVPLKENTHQILTKKMFAASFSTPDNNLNAELEPFHLFSATTRGKVLYTQQMNRWQK